MKAFLPALVLAAVAGAIAGPVVAQQGRGRPDASFGFGTRAQMPRPMASPGGMSSEERERLRQELNSARRDVYRDNGRPPEYDPRRGPQRPMLPAERERLRRDILDANRDLERRR